MKRCTALQSLTKRERATLADLLQRLYDGNSDTSPGPRAARR
jgi:hypothetical protein